MATNYRPVANIPFLGKVLERVVAGQLQALLDETDYLDPFQSSFRPGYGTESALVALYNDLCREKDRGSASLLILLDLSAAFDTIDHGILLDRLAGLGVGGTALQWFHSYLNDRFQKVVLGDYGSAPWQLCHGVPQGSILSPLLFNICMKPLGEVIRRCGLRNHQYADDTQLYLLFSTNPGEAVAVLNQCLAEVMGWMRANKLKLNPDKMEVLLVGGSGFGEGELNLVLNGVALPLRDKVRSLGVLLDPELSLEAQVTAVTQSAFLQLQLIHQLRPYLEYDCLETVTHVLVTSRLDFCNALYVGLPLKTVWILQLVQNRAARLLTGTGRYVHMTPVLRQLHWLPTEVRAQFKVLVMTYKALNSLGPGYLKERLRPYTPARPLRSAGEALLREPSVKEIRRSQQQSCGDFSVFHSSSPRGVARGAWQSRCVKGAFIAPGLQHLLKWSHQRFLNPPVKEREQMRDVVWLTSSPPFILTTSVKQIRLEVNGWPSRPVSLTAEWGVEPGLLRPCPAFSPPHRTCSHSPRDRLHPCACPWYPTCNRAKSEQCPLLKEQEGSQVFGEDEVRGPMKMLKRCPDFCIQLTRGFLIRSKEHKKQQKAARRAAHFHYWLDGPPPPCPLLPFLKHLHSNRLPQKEKQKGGTPANCFHYSRNKVLGAEGAAGELSPTLGAGGNFRATVPIALDALLAEVVHAVQHDRVPEEIEADGAGQLLPKALLLAL
ncbi:putative RNA-directed DNA polymerase from transposon BS, partial [Varanus komodoensis]